MSLNPSCKSTNSPKLCVFKEIAIELILKSLLFISSSRVPALTIGFLLLDTYDSFLEPTNSISYSSCLKYAVPKFLNTVTEILGSIVFILPSGIGVFESAIYYGIQTFISIEDAIRLSAISRIFMIVPAFLVFFSDSSLFLYKRLFIKKNIRM